MVYVIPDAVLPARIQQGMQYFGGFDTTVVQGTSGYQWANSRRVRGLRRWRLAHGEWLWTEDEIAGFKALIGATHGRLYGFLFADPFANVATTETLVAVPGDPTQLQLSVAATRGSSTYRYPITRPDSGSVTASVGGYSVVAGGKLQFGGTAPGGVTASFTYKIPVMFRSDDVAMVINGLTGNVPTFEIEEVVEN